MRQPVPAPVGMPTLTGIARPRVVNAITDTELNMLMFDPPVRPSVAVNTATMTARALDGASPAGAPLAGSVGVETAEMPRYADAPSRRQTITSPPITRTGFLPLDQNPPPRPRPVPQPVPQTPAPFPVQRPAADQHTEILPPVADATSGTYGLAAWLDRE